MAGHSYSLAASGWQSGLVQGASCWLGGKGLVASGKGLVASGKGLVASGKALLAC